MAPSRTMFAVAGARALRYDSPSVTLGFRENHPAVDFDEQCDGALLLDLADGGGAGGVVYVDGPEAAATRPFAQSLREHEIRSNRSP